MMSTGDLDRAQPPSAWTSRRSPGPGPGDVKDRKAKSDSSLSSSWSSYSSRKGATGSANASYDSKKAPVSRAITFGSRSRESEKVSHFLKQELEAVHWRDRSKWNFDFYNETPVKGGKYEWKKVTKSDTSGDSTSLYSSNKQKTDPNRPRNGLSPNKYRK